jgi:hypothetical protein
MNEKETMVNCITFTDPQHDGFFIRVQMYERPVVFCPAFLENDEFFDEDKILTVHTPVTDKESVLQQLTEIWNDGKEAGLTVQLATNPTVHQIRIIGYTEHSSYLDGAEQTMFQFFVKPDETLPADYFGLGVGELA